MIVHTDTAIGAQLSVTELNEPFGIPNLKALNLFVMATVLVEDCTIEALAMKGTLTIGKVDPNQMVAQ
jgi:hypothetical protein